MPQGWIEAQLSTCLPDQEILYSSYTEHLYSRKSGRDENTQGKKKKEESQKKEGTPWWDGKSLALTAARFES